MTEVKITEGYKQTEVGVIPKDWEVEPLKSLLKEPPKYGINAAAVPLTGNLPVYIRITDISEDGYYSPEKAVGVNSPFSNSYILNEGDIVLARTGASVGKSYLYKKEDGILIYAGFLIKVSPNEKQLNPKYLHQYLKTEQYWAWVIVNSMRSGQPGINGNEYGRLLIPLPSIKEQTAIATALSDVDNLIQSLDKLIAKKEAIKTGTMQQLLTGKTRLPEFTTREDGCPKGLKQTELGKIPEDWEVSPMRALTTLMTNGFVGTAKSHYTDASDGILYIQGYNVKENSFNFHGIKRVTQSFHIKNSKSCLQTGDVLMVQTGDVGMTTIVPPKLENSNCHALIINRFKKNMNPKYFSYYFNSSKGRSRLKEIEVGTTMKHINVGNLLDFQVPYPCLGEQTAIATILSDMDAEMQVLQERLDKTRDIKQGMMQQLLAGKVRLAH